MKYKAELFGFVGLGLIVECPSGVIWSNQTGGAFNLHPEVEGLFVPLRTAVRWPNWPQGSSRPADAAEPVLVGPAIELMEYFWGPKYAGRGAEWGLDVEDADFIDAVLAKHSLGAFVTLDRERLKDSDEAWVHVTVHRELKFTGVALLPCPGVLTWLNSD